MKSLSRIAQLYIMVSLIVGTSLSVWLLGWVRVEPSWLLLGTCAVGALLQTLKINGATARTSYNLSWITYGFAFVLLGTPATLLVIIVAHLVEWIWHRYPWYIQSFNIASFAMVVSSAGFVYAWMNPRWTLVAPMSVVAILVVMALFTILNHWLVGIVIQLARGQSLTESGVFGRITLMLDFGLLTVGAAAALIWLVNPYAIVLVFFFAYLLHNGLMVPALQRQVETDPKTGLFNARHFVEKVQEEFARAHRFNRPLTVVMSDLDLLREVNNKYGHLAGDVVLHGVADILKKFSRDYEWVARFGGEEFAILMPETALEAAHTYVEEIRQHIEATEFVVTTSVTPIKVTMSFGIAQFRRQDHTAEELIHRADMAVYQAKLNGRNQIALFQNIAEAVLTLESAKMDKTDSAAAPTTVQPITPLKPTVQPITPLKPTLS